MTSIPAAPKCAQCGVNDAEYDSEPGRHSPSGSYSDDCLRCSRLNHALAPHLHDNIPYNTRALFLGNGKTAVMVARRCTKRDCNQTLDVEFRPGATVTPEMYERSAV